MSDRYQASTTDRKVGLRDQPEQHFPSPDPSAIPEIWGGMTGSIYILLPTWNRNRIARELLGDLENPDSEIGSRLRELELSPDQVLAVYECISRYGNHLVEGDVNAKTHILGTLRCLYDPTVIEEIDPWDLGDCAEKIRRNSRFNEIKYDNLILIGGPIGNPATDVFLEKQGLRWLFPSEGRQAYSIRTSPQSDDLLSPDGELPDTVRKDCGVFLRMPNPFNPSARVYAVMGGYAWGTQAAAALACAGPSAAEMLEARETNPFASEAAYPVEMCAWVRTWPGMKPDQVFTDFEDPGILYQIASPSHPRDEQWQIHSNPRCINFTLRSLKRLVASLRKTQLLLIPNRIGHLLGFAACTSLFTGVAYGTVLGRLSIRWGILPLIVGLLGVLLFFLRLWPVSAIRRDIAALERDDRG